jgi:hypothetical protein
MCIGLVLSCAAYGARANDEYVNPIYCYRVVMPAPASSVTPNKDESGLTMRLGASCRPAACVRLGIFSGDIQLNGEYPAIAYDAFVGSRWKIRAMSTVKIGSITWAERHLQKGATMLDVYESEDVAHRARFKVAVMYGKSSSAVAKKTVNGILTSWRFLSECV